MNTPIFDFVKAYCEKKPLRFHMPGHKGKGPLGMEGLDITEFSGADDLFHPTGIISDSERNASHLFGWPTLYATEGSSLCIRTMLFLAYTGNGCQGSVLAGRNAHKSFLHTAVLLDFPIHWLQAGDDYLSCPITAADVEHAIQQESEKPCAVYLTSPDYLGNLLDISSIAEVCRQYSIPLLVDNAHGAYLKFLEPSSHPMDLGATFCCDSAHKTLPVLTGGAYLHLQDPSLLSQARDALALFGSTSPSYLILQSLDCCNPYLEFLSEKLSRFLPRIQALKASLSAHGFSITGEEPLKLTLLPANYGYTGSELGELLENQNIFCEFQDLEHLVFMFTPENMPEQLQVLEQALLAVPRRNPLILQKTKSFSPEPVCTPRQAMFAKKETIPVEESAGRILAAASVSCPPAVPLIMCGERISEELIPLLRYHDVSTVTVIKTIFQEQA